MSGMKKDGKSHTIFLGAVLGALSGMMVAILCQRYRHRRAEGETSGIQPQKLVRVGVAMAALFRQFLDLLS